MIFERFNLLSWQQSLSAGVVGYFIYRDGIKIASVNANTFQYADQNRKEGIATIYSVSAFDASGSESPSVSTTVY